MDESYNFVCDESAIRLDRYVSEKCPDFSRTYVQKLVVDGYITVNGLHAKPGIKLNAGDEVAVTIPPIPILPSRIPVRGKLRSPQPTPKKMSIPKLSPGTYPGEASIVILSVNLTI